MELSKEQKDRYARNVIIREIGTEGQEKLLNSSVLVIGAGGLGSPAIMYLASAGVGTIGIADNDKVDLSNLQRQIIHTTKTIGTAKVSSAKQAVLARNPDIKVNTYNEFINAYNIMELIREYDFIIDATDNFSAKFLINDACVLAGKPFSHAGVIRFEGQTMTYVPGISPCYRCIFQEPPEEGTVPNCKQEGILGAAAGIIGSIQAMEAVKYLLNLGNLLTGYLLVYDGLNMEFRKVKLPDRTAACPVCGDNPVIQDISCSIKEK